MNSEYLNKTTGSKNKKINDCKTCRITKSSQLPYLGTRPKNSQPLDNIHIDLSGIPRIPCIYGYSYFLLIVDEATRMMFIFFLKTKTSEEILDFLNLFVTCAEQHWDKKVKIITSDGGGEFVNNLLSTYCDKIGIIKSTTAPYSLTPTKLYCGTSNANNCKKSPISAYT